MVNLTKIYTRTGDDGTTSLGDFSRTSKNDDRLHAYADTNEANAAIGIAIAAGGLDDEVKATLPRIQNELFDVGADLSTRFRRRTSTRRCGSTSPGSTTSSATATTTSSGSRSCAPSSFPAAARLRLPARRDDHRAAGRAGGLGRDRRPRRPSRGTERGIGGVNVLTATYLNRLSDLLFILARIANLPIGGDILWQPGGGRVAKPEKKQGQPQRR